MKFSYSIMKWRSPSRQNPSTNPRRLGVRLNHD
jgi:hypothetical protein